ncbi:SET domain-containing protein 3, partial [Linderina pennispora]
MLPASAAIVRDGGGDSTPDEDQGVIRCICGINDDDGFTIQCENCLVWQHAVCVGVEQDNVPDEYLCEKCNPRKLDVKKAIEYQKRRLDTEYRHSKETRKKAKYVAGKAKKTDDGGERKKRIHDGKQPRVKHTKGALGRDSSSPTVVRSGDGYRRESSSFADASYSQIEQNILGPDVQILFQSVLSQLAEQRDMVSAASASVTASAAVVAAAAAEPSESADTATSEHKSPESGMPSGTTAVSPTTAAPVSNKEDGIVAMPPPVRDNPSPLPSIVSMNSESLRSPAPTYSSFVAK